MSLSIKSLAVVLALATLATGCAQPSRKSAMVAPVSSQTILSEDSMLRKNVAIDRVSGGKETSPLWMSQVSTADFEEALRLSLKQHDMLGATDAPLIVEANLIKLDQPLIGLDMTVTSTVQYSVRTADGATAFDETIVSPYTADFSSSFLGVERLRLANEGAIRKSIADFIAAVVADAKVDPTKYGAPPPTPTSDTAPKTS